MSFGAANSRIRLAAVWQVIRSVAESSTISMAARAALINMATEIGHFIELLRREDLANVSDSQKATFYKVSADALGALDKYVAQLNKSRQDSSVLSDDQSFAVHKAFSDLSRLIDTQKRTFGKFLQDQVVGLEDHAYVFAMKAPENRTELLDRIETKGTFKVKSDVSNFADDDTRSFVKNRADTTGFTDSRYQLIQKVLTDVVGLTDDIDGAASLDDDQEVQFFKVIGDATRYQDEFYRFVSFVRSFSDSVGMVDQKNATVSKVKVDQAAVTDTANRLVAKPLQDIGGIGDRTSSTVGKPLSDASVLSDKWVSEILKPRADLASVVDATASMLAKVKSDLSSLSDKQVSNFTKSVSDRVNVVDFLDYITIVVKRDFFENPTLVDRFSHQLQKLLSSEIAGVSERKVISSTKALPELAFLSEVLYRVTNKQLTNTSNVSELKAISAVKPKQDGFSTTDSGSLRSQSYCDFTYIAEDYVGVSRTF